MRTLFIAEAGVNHNGEMLLAEKLIKVAAESGADIVKFQSFSASKLVTKTAKMAEYQIQNTKSSETQFSMLQSLELTRGDHERLKEICQSIGVEFLSSGFDLDSLKMLAEIGQKRFKIPSGEITNLPNLRFIGQLNCQTILSTGMATLKEVDDAITVLVKSGTDISKITLLHCTSNYPALAPEVNLNAMLTLRTEFGLNFGYSDHTQGIEVAIAAVALGATVIEKHFTIDHDLPGPDHRASLEPHELRELIRSIRVIESAMGDGIKKPTQSEERTKQLVRKSIVALREIRKGDRFSEFNIGTKRPGTGISPMFWDEIVGQESQRDYLEDEMIVDEK
jgi:N,N'-diacetyllegionaminate synthase